MQVQFDNEIVTDDYMQRVSDTFHRESVVYTALYRKRVVLPNYVRSFYVHMLAAPASARFDLALTQQHDTFDSLEWWLNSEMFETYAAWMPRKEPASIASTDTFEFVRNATEWREMDGRRRTAHTTDMCAICGQRGGDACQHTVFLNCDALFPNEDADERLVNLDHLDALNFQCDDFNRPWTFVYVSASDMIGEKKLTDYAALVVNV